MPKKDQMRFLIMAAPSVEEMEQSLLEADIAARKPVDFTVETVKPSTFVLPVRILELPPAEKGQFQSFIGLDKDGNRILGNFFPETGRGFLKFV